MSLHISITQFIKCRVQIENGIRLQNNTMSSETKITEMS
jgi:hypothetical protein